MNYEISEILRLVRFKDLTFTSVVVITIGFINHFSLIDVLIKIITFKELLLPKEKRQSDKN